MPGVSTGIRNILDTAISDDGTTFEMALDCVFTHRIQMRKIEMLARKTPQPVLSLDKMFNLEKNGDKYCIRRLSDGSPSVPDGDYFFVVSVEHPCEILCAKLILSSSGERCCKEGHTSFEGQTVVYFAGMMKFTQGLLNYWSNGSGHFRPKPESRYHFLPVVKLLLPEYLFRMERGCGFYHQD